MIMEARPMSPKFKLIMLFGFIALTGCASVGGPSVQVTAQASETPYFSLSRPAVYKAGDRLALTGRVCRRSRTTVLSPSGIRLEHLTAVGALAETAHAFVGPIYSRADQACSSYTIRVAWTLAEGDTINACFDRGHVCPTQPSVKAIVQAPATASPPSP